MDLCCQLTRVLGEASLLTVWAAELHHGAYPLLHPCTCKSSAFQGRSCFLEGRTMGPMSSVACLGFLEWGGLGGLHTLLCAWQRVRLSSVPNKQHSLQALGILFSSCRLVPGDLLSLAADL